MRAQAAKRFLNFAIQFTPQYGDSFVEYLRLKFLIAGVHCPEAYERVSQLCVNADPNYGQMWFHCKQQVLSILLLILVL